MKVLKRRRIKIKNKKYSEKTIISIAVVALFLIAMFLFFFIMEELSDVSQKMPIYKVKQEKEVIF